MLAYHTVLLILQEVLYHRCFQIPGFANIPMVKSFMRSVFQLGLSLPRYKTVWNVHFFLTLFVINNVLKIYHLKLLPYD